MTWTAERTREEWGEGKKGNGLNTNPRTRLSNWGSNCDAEIEDTRQKTTDLYYIFSLMPTAQPTSSALRYSNYLLRTMSHNNTQLSRSLFGLSGSFSVSHREQCDLLSWLFWSQSYSSLRPFPRDKTMWSFGNIKHVVTVVTVVVSIRFIKVSNGK
jgi:hypothetical protein